MRLLIIICLSISTLAHAAGKAPRTHSFREVVKGSWTALQDETRAVAEKARVEAGDFENFRQKNVQSFRTACEADRSFNRFCDIAVTKETEAPGGAVPPETRKRMFDVLTKLDDARGRARACPGVTAELESLVADDGAKILHSRARYWLWACAKATGDVTAAANWREELWQHHPLSHLAFEAMSADDDARWAEALTEPEVPWPVESRFADDTEMNDVLRGIEALLELEKAGAAAVVLKRYQARFAEASPELQLYVGALSARVARSIPHIQPVFRTLEPLLIAHREYLRRPILEILYPRPDQFFEELLNARGNVDAGLFAGLVHQESAMYPRARSRVAFGLTQLVPTTATEVNATVGAIGGPVTGEMLFDPHLSLTLGAAYLTKLSDKFGDERLALAAYHSGDDRLQKWIKATYKFIDPVVRAHALYLDANGATSTAVYILSVQSRANYYRALYGSDLTAR